MTRSRRFHLASITASCAIALGCIAPAAFAADAPKPKAAKPAAKPAKAAKKPVVVVLPAADNEQLEAAKLVYYGHYECGFQQIVDITEDSKDAGYVDVKHGKALYVMKPVLSTTGALRLEDVKGQTLMVQIANKSMLLDVKAGHRIVDDCVSPKQRELMEAVTKAKEAAAAASAASAAAAPASAPGQDVNGATPYPPASAPVK
jgi:hypothetical protein